MDQVKASETTPEAPVPITVVGMRDGEMAVTFGNASYQFHLWRPEMGRVCQVGFAFTCETTLIDTIPVYVIGACFDGQRGYFVQQQDVDSFFSAHAGLSVAIHDAPSSLDVIHTIARSVDIYRTVEEGRIWDTLLLHRLYTLGLKQARNLKFDGVADPA